MMGLSIFISLGTVIGVWLCIKGFSLWYKRLQRFQDEILQNEASKSGKAGDEFRTGSNRVEHETSSEKK